MSRFDDELIKQADNAWQMHGLPEPTTPRQIPYLQNVQPYGDALVPGQVNVVEQVANISANRPLTRPIEVRDLEAADPSNGGPGEIVGMPGMSNVYALGGPDPATQPGALAPSTGLSPVVASIDPIDESLYNVYKASRDIRTAIKNEVDFDFSELINASNDAATVLRFANTDQEVNQVIGTVASIVLDIESDLIQTGDFKQASSDLSDLEGLLEEINKFAAKKNCKHCKGKGCDKCKKEDEDEDDEKDSKSAAKKDCKHCKGKGCDKCKKSKSKKKDDDDDDDEDDDEDDDRPAFLKGKGKKKEATNGNQETGVTVDVRDLDDQAGVWDRGRVMAPDFTTNPLDAEEVNGADAGYVDYYNDGSSTGITPGQEPHKQEVWPYDGTNPAIAPYQQGVVAAVQSSREKIFGALQIVDRLEKLGMVQEEDRAKHIANFEQMSDAKLAGVKASLDMFEESGARQPRSQKVASGNSRLPEMGRLTTASTVSRQQLSADDWLMTL